MNKKTLETIWLWFVIITITIVCIIGSLAILDQNPLTSMTKLKYIFAIVFIATPINLILMYFTCKTKK